ncbi:MAG: response regulator transcription factor [Dehalococcoidia bacterium]|nr:response regulator transcription factor [Dehalococcoidia bacterium]
MSNSEKIKVLVADDHGMVREGICLVLKGYDDIEVIGEAADGAQAVEQVNSLKPDVVLMDISMPVMGGMDAIQAIKQKHPDVQILALTVHENPEYLRRVLALGAAGYVLKGSSSGELVSAVRAVHSHGMYLDPKVTRKLVDEFVPREGASEAKGAYGDLSKREREVLKYIAEGQTNLEIGRMLFLSPNTVQTYRSRIMEKLGLHGRAELMKYALRAGFLDRD